jgi:hypothetical protein
MNNVSDEWRQSNNEPGGILVRVASEKIEHA